MKNRVSELQDAFQSAIKVLKKNKKVLAIFTFGSIVSGDVWEESDIDLFVVYKDNFDEIRDIFSEKKGVPIHGKLLSKDKFIELHNNEGKKGFIRDLLAKSKLIYSKDKDITYIYNSYIYSPNPHVDKWNLVYLGDVIKDLGVCKKYLSINKIYTSYEVLIRLLDGVSKIFLNINGYESTKDSLVMACNLNANIKNIVDNLFNKEINKEIIKDTVQFVDNFIDENILDASKLLIDYLANNKEQLSSYEIYRDELFKEFNIKIENILKELSKRGLIAKDKRLLKDSFGAKIMEENVYFFK